MPLIYKNMYSSLPDPHIYGFEYHRELVNIYLLLTEKIRIDKLRSFSISKDNKSPIYVYIVNDWKAAQ
jgi:hypothetical protein